MCSLYGIARVNDIQNDIQMQNARFVQFWICMCSLYGIARVNDIQNDIQMQNARLVQFWICMCSLYGAAILQPACIPYKLHIQMQTARMLRHTNCTYKLENFLIEICPCICCKFLILGKNTVFAPTPQIVLCSFYNAFWHCFFLPCFW